MSRIIFYLSYLYRSQRTFWILDGDWNPHGGQGACRRHFLMLMVGTPGFLSAPIRGTIDIS
jgi:hypothetical protein